MAQTIQFGGTNGVPEIDFGLPGGTLHGAGNARSTMALIEGQVMAPAQQVAMPDQNFTAVARGGFHGQVLTADGQFVLASHALMNTLLDNIEDRRSNASLMQPTRLVNNNTARTWTAVILDDFQPAGARRLTAQSYVVLLYRILFKVVRR